MYSLPRGKNRSPACTIHVLAHPVSSGHGQNPILLVGNWIFRGLVWEGVFELERPTRVQVERLHQCRTGHAAGIGDSYGVAARRKSADASGMHATVGQRLGAGGTGPKISHSEV
jgi:hypothetical protein